MRFFSSLAAVVVLWSGIFLSPRFVRVVRAQDAETEFPGADFEEFAEVLEPHGRWVEVDGFGLCWRPRVDTDWAPYTVGRWVYTEAGWTWVSDEPFGGIVYHYGRWLLTHRGWCWVPGQVWGPAWVSWRTNADYIGWAPLPPEVPWSTSRGIGAWVDVQADIGPSYYRFCSVRNFGERRIHTAVIPVSRNAAILVNTRNVTSIYARERFVHCGGPDYGWVNSRCARPVVSLTLALQPSLNAFISLGFSSQRTNAVASDALYLPAPARIQKPRAQNFIVPPGQADLRPTRGWSSNRETDRRVATHISQEWERHRSAIPSTPPPNAGVSGVTGISGSPASDPEMRPPAPAAPPPIQPTPAVPGEKRGPGSGTKLPPLSQTGFVPPAVSPAGREGVPSDRRPPSGERGTVSGLEVPGERSSGVSEPKSPSLPPNPKWAAPGESKAPGPGKTVEAAGNGKLKNEGQSGASPVREAGGMPERTFPKTNASPSVRFAPAPQSGAPGEARISSQIFRPQGAENSSPPPAGIVPSSGVPGPVPSRGTTALPTAPSLSRPKPTVTGSGGSGMFPPRESVRESASRPSGFPQGGSGSSEGTSSPAFRSRSFGGSSAPSGNQGTSSFASPGSSFSRPASAPSGSGFSRPSPSPTPPASSPPPSFARPSPSPAPSSSAPSPGGSPGSGGTSKKPSESKKDEKK